MSAQLMRSERYDELTQRRFCRYPLLVCQHVAAIEAGRVHMLIFSMTHVCLDTKAFRHFYSANA